MGRVKQLLLDRLNYYKRGLGKKHHVKKYSKVVEMIGRLKEKYSRAAGLYDITVIPEQDGERDIINAIDIHWQRKSGYDEKEKNEGGIHYHNTLRTNSRMEPEHLEVYTKLGLSGRSLAQQLLTRKISSGHKSNQSLLQ